MRTGRSIPLLLAPLVIAVACVAARPAQADAISTDLTITGQITFDTSFAVASDATVGGAMVVKEGGTDTTTTIAGTAVSAGANPLGGVFTNTGDGLGIDGFTGSTSGASGAWGSGFDLTLTLANASVSETHTVTLKLVYANSVDADGGDAFAASEFTLDDEGGTERFATDLTSDTRFGDAVDGGPLGTYGDLLSATGTQTFALTLAPGATLTWTGALTSEGGTYAGTAGAESFFDVFFSIEMGPAIPEPTTLALLGLGLAGVALGRRRKGAQAARARGATT